MSDQYETPIPLNARLFIRALLGDRTPVTEKSLTRTDLAALLDIVTQSSAAGSNKITYSDYTPSYENRNLIGDLSGETGSPEMVINWSQNNPYYRLLTSLGQAGLQLDAEGNLHVIDQYDFNGISPPLGQMLKSLLGDSTKFYEFLRDIGGNFGPKEGEGMPVDINLGKIK